MFITSIDGLLITQNILRVQINNVEIKLSKTFVW